MAAAERQDLGDIRWLSVPEQHEGINYTVTVETTVPCDRCNHENFNTPHKWLSSDLLRVTPYPGFKKGILCSFFCHFSAGCSVCET
jgi:hypothetical protein